jgi:hypothetical protein
MFHRFIQICFCFNAFGPNYRNPQYLLKNSPHFIYSICSAYQTYQLIKKLKYLSFLMKHPLRNVNQIISSWHKLSI